MEVVVAKKGSPALILLVAVCSEGFFAGIEMHEP